MLRYQRMQDDQLRPTEKARARMPEYRAGWAERARDFLEELRPKEFARLVESSELESRVNSMVDSAEKMLLLLLERGMELDEALKETAEMCLQVEPEPESYEEEEAEARQESL